MKEYIFQYIEGIPVKEGDYIFVLKDNSLAPGYIYKPGPLTDISEPQYYTIGTMLSLLKFKPSIIKGYMRLEEHKTRVLSEGYYGKEHLKKEKGTPTNPPIP